jgi:hypothetical protein
LSQRFADALPRTSLGLAANPDLREKIDLIFGDLIKWLTERMVSRLPAGLSQSDISSFSDELLQTAKLLNDEFAEEIETHSREKYVDPV